MPEGLSASEVGKEIGEHAEHADPHERRDRLISIIEAVLLSVVALLAAWSGYAAAKWSTESRVELATASKLRIEASRADSDAGELRDFDSSTFESWFAAYTVGQQDRHAGGGTQVPARVQGRLRRLARDEAGDEPRSAAGAYVHAAVQAARSWPRLGPSTIKPKQPFSTAKDGSTADKYIRLTVVLASILFLVGISTHFPYRSIRYGLIGWASPCSCCRSSSCQRCRCLRPELSEESDLRAPALRTEPSTCGCRGATAGLSFPLDRVRPVLAGARGAVIPLGLGGAVSPVMLTEQTVLLAGPDGGRAGYATPPAWSSPRS